MARSLVVPALIVPPFMFAALMMASPMVAQAVPRVVLGKPEARAAEPFDNASFIRELRDGRVIVTDRLAKVVSLVDFRTGRATSIGREGQGPGEFAYPGALIPLPGDTTLLLDIGLRRFLVIDPAGKATGLVPFPEETAGLPRVKGADRAGRIYMEAGGIMGRMDATATLPDSVPVLRWDRARKRIDTLGMVKAPTTTVARSGSAGAMSVMMRREPFAPQDDWAVAPDGRVAAVRTANYHVDWFGGAGTRVSGPPVAYQKVAVTQADKDRMEKAASDPRSRVTMTIGGPAPAGGRGAAPGVRPQLGATTYPEFKPPFRENSALVAPDGSLWVQRYGAAAADPVYDVFDAAGRLVRQVGLPKDSRLVGFGAAAAYVATKDEDDTEVLARYRIP